MWFGNQPDLTLHPFAGLDVWQLLRLRAQRSGGRPFLLWHPYEGEPAEWTFGQLYRDAAAVAAGLSARGVGRGDRILLHLNNSPELVLSWFACAALGAVAVVTNTRSSADELGYYVADARPVGAITEPAFAGLMSASAGELDWLVTTAGAGSDDSFSGLGRDPNEHVSRPADPTLPLCVLYTSGTTSRPKGVVWTHANALWGARVNASHEDLHPEDCHLTYHPLFHANALAFSMLPSLWVGARFVLVPKWSTSRFWEVSQRYGCTWLSLMGLSYRTLLSADVPDEHSYRLFGSAWCDTPLDERLRVKTIGWFAMTETISHPIVGSPFTPDRPMSMGRPAPEYRVKVVPAGGTGAARTDEVGQLWVDGVPGLSLAAGYLNQPEATAASFDGRWFRTGDLAVVHDDGFLTFVDRAKDMLKVGGENVAASEVERVLLQTGLVVEAAVVGRPDEKLDEVPVAFVIPRGHQDGDVASLTAECERLLADFKVPRAVYPVRELPRSSISKVDKVELRRYAGPDADRETAVQRWQAAAFADPVGDSSSATGQNLHRGVS